MSGQHAAPAAVYNYERNLAILLALALPVNTTNPMFAVLQSAAECCRVSCVLTPAPAGEVPELRVLQRVPPRPAVPHLRLQRRSRPRRPQPHAGLTPRDSNEGYPKVRNHGEGPY